LMLSRQFSAGRFMPRYRSCEFPLMSRRRPVVVWAAGGVLLVVTVAA